MLFIRIWRSRRLRGKPRGPRSAPRRHSRSTNSSTSIMRSARLRQKLGRDGQLTHALAGRGEDRVRHRGRDGWRGDLPDAAGWSVARDDVNLYFGHVTHAQHLVAVEVALDRKSTR